MISHWDELPWTRMERGHIGGDWQSLTGDRSVAAGVKRIRVDAGRWSTPAHVENSEEEIFYVLSGSGISWQDGACYDVAAGDCLVHTAGTEAHTLRAGADGLEVLAFGERHRGAARGFRGRVSPGASARGCEPESRTSIRGSSSRKPASPSWSNRVERPAWIVNAAAVESEPFGRGSVSSEGRDLGRAAGSVRTGLNLVSVPAGKLNVPPHCHSAEEEIFVVLDGEGELELTPTPSAWPDAVTGTFPVRAGSTVARPAGSASRALLSRRARRADAPVVRNARAERHRLLPALGQGQLSRDRPDRPARASLVLGRRGLRLECRNRVDTLERDPQMGLMRLLPRPLVRSPSTTEETSLQRVIVFANQKGGVAKTTTTLNLGVAFKEQGHRVLVIDLDPQGNLTMSQGMNPDAIERSMFDVLVHRLPITEIIHRAEVDVAVSSIDLAGAELALSAMIGRERALEKALFEVRDSYDFIMVDTPPSLGLLTINAFVAATGVIVPVQCEYLSLRGLVQLENTLAMVRENLNPDVKIEGILPTMFDARTLHAREAIEILEENFGDLVFKTRIRKTVRYAEAPVKGSSIMKYDPNGTAAEAYRDLAKEVLHGAKSREHA